MRTDVTEARNFRSRLLHLYRCAKVGAQPRADSGYLQMALADHATQSWNDDTSNRWQFRLTCADAVLHASVWPVPQA